MARSPHFTDKETEAQITLGGFLREVGPFGTVNPPLCQMAAYRLGPGQSGPEMSAVMGKERLFLRGQHVLSRPEDRDPCLPHSWKFPAHFPKHRGSQKEKAKGSIKNSV